MSEQALLAQNLSTQTEGKEDDYLTRAFCPLKRTDRYAHYLVGRRTGYS